MPKERRRFFRIDDTVGLSYHLLSDDEMRARAAGERLPQDPFNLIASYESKIENGLSQLRVKDPAIAAVLENLNHKVNCVIDQLEAETRFLRRVVPPSRPVNISACGMAFESDQAIEPGRVMRLNLVLQPTDLHLSIYGEVVGCDAPQAERSHYVRVNFVDIDPTEQEVLIQHIVKRQGHILRGE